jgi:hypothetical protein
MPNQRWQSFEDNVRYLASSIFEAECKPENIGGVDIDGVIHSSEDINIFIEITVRSDLSKVREDIIKLKTAKDCLLHQSGAFARCYCIIDSNVTRAMLDAAKPYKIKVLSFSEFRRLFLDYEEYRSARAIVAFGSAINPLTGARDESSYVPVTYIDRSTSQEYTVEQICGLLEIGRRIVLLGEYGTGKSRCIREVFSHMSLEASRKQLYPIAIDLRDSWGVKKGTELIRHHLQEIGQDALARATLRAFQAQTIVPLLDGFDELGSQAWSNNTERLIAIRARSLQGVRELASSTENGFLISGREHYFNNNDEMFLALGLDQKKTLVLYCKTEFSEMETQEYFKRLQEDVSIPEWLPRRPLICQTISVLTEDQFEQMFGAGQDEIEFWEHFIRIICERDARINLSFDPVTIERILTYLARITRTKLANTGPITLNEIQAAFESVVGQSPVEDASVMLQRLPALGRVNSGSNERQFIDTYILDGLRAKDIAATMTSDESQKRLLLNTRFINPLNDLGQKILARKMAEKNKEFLGYVNRIVDGDYSANLVLASDIISSLLRGGHEEIDFRSLKLSDGHFLRFDMSETIPINLTLMNSALGVLVLPSAPPAGTSFSGCIADRVVGISAQNALPVWISRFSADHYDSTESVSRIRQIGLSAAEEILVTIVRKIFFQKGSGRKEEALLRGLGRKTSKAVAESILGILISEGIVSRFKGDEGWVYTPNRTHAGRMKSMLYELKTSSDVIWNKTKSLM